MVPKAKRTPVLRDEEPPGLPERVSHLQPFQDETLPVEVAALLSTVLRAQKGNLAPELDEALRRIAEPERGTSVANAADDALTDDMLRADLAFFASSVLQGPLEAPYDGHFLISRHHEEWSDLIAAHDRVCIVAARDHGKSFLATIAYGIWQSWRLPKNEGMIFSSTDERAQEILDKIKVEIETNPRLKHLMPQDLRTRVWTKSKIRLTNGSTIIAKGFGVKTRGAHPKWVVCDDVLNDEDAYSETTRGRNIDYFLSAIANLPSPSNDPTLMQILFVGTPYHAADLFGYLEENEEWVFKRYAAFDAHDQPLWPEKWSAERLLRKRREIGEIRFSREYMCRPVSASSSLFPEELFRAGYRQLLYLGAPKAAWEERGVEAFYMGVDIAVSATTQADYFVIFVIGLDNRGNRYVVDIFRERGLAYEMQKQKIKNLARQYSCELVFIESNQAQQIYGKELQRETDLPVYPVQTGSDKHHLEKGLPGVRIFLEQGKYRIPRGDQKSRDMTNLWIGEMSDHTFDGEVKCVGKHDDLAMACWITEKAMRAGAFSFSSESTDEDEAAFREEYGFMFGMDAEPAADEGHPGDEYDVPSLMPEEAEGMRRANLAVEPVTPPRPNVPGLTGGARGGPTGFPNVPGFGGGAGLPMMPGLFGGMHGGLA